MRQLASAHNQPHSFHRLFFKDAIIFFKGELKKYNILCAFDKILSRMRVKRLQKKETIKILWQQLFQDCNCSSCTFYFEKWLCNETYFRKICFHFTAMKTEELLRQAKNF